MPDNNIKRIADLIKASNNVIVFTGAGISTNCGIPDFRGDNGLYSFVMKKYNLPYPEAIFDINFFKNNPEPFYDLSKGFFLDNIEPSLSHKFIAWLESNDKSILVVTQNIDMLHQKAGSSNVIECHGTYVTAHCIKCNKFYPLKDVEDSFKNGKVPYCSCKGIIKPDVVFFGERLPDKFYEIYQNPPDADLIIVMGTSLTVQPAASFALNFVGNINSVIINKESTDFDELFNFVIHSDLDVFTKQIWDIFKER